MSIEIAELPIDAVLPGLRTALAGAGNAVLVAPPGAGKTTRVPLDLLSAPWRGDGRIVVLEPRRIAARAAAERMAAMLGERVGETVGLRARLDTRVGRKTRVEVVTEGVFTRMILGDPELDGTAAVLFDEFHERSLDADLSLALALDARAALRPDLRLLVMSATLAGTRVSGLLGNAPLIESEGRMFPVETRYSGRDASLRLEDRMADVIVRALDRDDGSVLAFLPGQAEIRRTAERLDDRIRDPGVILAPLYGALSPAEQDRAILPAPDGRRKVVLATSIAETSITIEGVRIVVDCGLSRQPRYEPGTGITRLETVRASLAAVDQRRGRAGRTAPGVCYRLWDEPQTRSLPAFAEPEIRTADLSGLLLDLADWGVTDPAALAWLDPPPAAAIAVARDMLTDLGALEKDGAITPVGRALRRLPLPPRLAAMIVSAAARHGEAAASDAAHLAALLVERGLGGNEVDLTERLGRFRNDRGRRAAQMRALSSGWAQEATKEATKEAANSAAAIRDTSGATGARPAPAAHLAVAFPDRIAKARGKPGQFLLAGGRGGHLDPTERLAREPFLVVAELQGAAAATRILAAAPLPDALLADIAGTRISTADELAYDGESRSVRLRRTTRLGAITLAAEPGSLDALPAAEIAAALASGIAAEAAPGGIEALPWSKSQRQLRARAGFLRDAGDETIPDLAGDVLAAAAAEWLAPFIEGRSRAAEITAADLGNALDALLPWPLRQHLDEAAPTHFLAPTGERHPIDYDGPLAPSLAIRVQELFGLKQHPAIAGGRLPLTLELLSPAHRPIQITRDLPGFWRGSWAAAKSDMKGRYPKHVWPDDPANAEPTRRAKPRGI